jgi:hypothetical protein
MGTAIIAVIGTLLGTVTAAGMQHLMTVSARRDRDRHTRATAIAQLLSAATDHRREQYLKHVANRNGEPDTRDTRAARYKARSAMTTALTAVRLSGAPTHLVDLAADLVTASTALGDTPSHDQAAVDTAGEHARRAHAALETAATR